MTLEPPSSSELATSPYQSERVLVSYHSQRSGPAFLAVGSLHGNEPAGRLAIERVATQLHAAREQEGFGLLCGDFLGLAGNLSALEMRMRYVDTDLNRGWSRERLDRLASQGPQSVEDREMLELHRAIEKFRTEAHGDLHFLDLHTTSGDSPPFASVVNRKIDRELVSALPVPTVLGIDTHLEGTFLECMQQAGFAGVVYEGGQHDDPIAVDQCEAAIWLILEKLAMISVYQGKILENRIAWAHACLDPIGRRYPELLQIESRFALERATDFVMEPGYRSFQPVRKGDLLAHHRDEEVRSDRDGMILMPLYQPQGDEGFFLMSEIGG